MNIAMAANKEYAKYLNVALTSVMETNQTRELSFYVIDQGISEESKKRIEKNVNKYGKRIMFIPTDELLGGGETGS